MQSTDIPAEISTDENIVTLTTLFIATVSYFCLPVPRLHLKKYKDSLTKKKEFMEPSHETFSQAGNVVSRRDGHELPWLSVLIRSSNMPACFIRYAPR